MFTDTPSMLAMLITLDGRSCVAFARRAACSAWVRKNGVFTFRSITLSQPLSGKVSNDSPQAAPALLTSMSSVVSCSRYCAAMARAPSAPEQSPTNAMQVPKAESRSAVAWHAAALRAVTYTFAAPARRNPSAIISPMPRDPPVTNATRPSSEK